MKKETTLIDIIEGIAKSRGKDIYKTITRKEAIIIILEGIAFILLSCEDE